MLDQQLSTVAMILKTRIARSSGLARETLEDLAWDLADTFEGTMNPPLLHLQGSPPRPTPFSSAEFLHACGIN